MRAGIGSGKAPSTPQSGRILYLDSLRVIAVLMVFLFHASKPFTAGDWHVTNAQTSLVATVLFDALLAPWGMPFFFLLAGGGAWFALQRRTTRQFAIERVKRLLVPFLVGSILFTPIQTFIEWSFAVKNKGFVGTSLEFFLSRWSGWDTRIAGTIGYHLWFLAFLFCFSLLALPLLTWLKGSGQTFIAWLCRMCDHRGAILLLALPPLMIQVGLRPYWPEEHNWADFLYDFFFFLAGYLIFADERIRHSIRRDRWLVLVVGCLALAGLMASLALGEAENLFSNPDAPGYRLFWALASIDAWCWSIVMLYVGMRFLDFRNQWLHIGQEAVVPFYLVHQPVILAVAFFVVQWQVGLVLKMLVVVLLSFALTASIYWLLIRRLALLRLLFGMKNLVPRSVIVEIVPKIGAARTR